MRVRPNFWDFQEYQKPEFLANLQSLQAKDPERHKKYLQKYQTAMQDGHYQQWLKDKDNIGSAGWMMGNLPSGVYDPKNIKKPKRQQEGGPIPVGHMLSRGR